MRKYGIYFTNSTDAAAQRYAIEVLQEIYETTTASVAKMENRVVMAESMLAFSKPENILIKSYSRCEIKVIDLGSSCFKNDRLSLYVQSKSYRAPEVILGFPYDQKVDLGSLGCILAELLSGDVLFPNDEIVFFLARVIGMIGPIDFDMLQRGQETSKYFTDDFDLYHINEETNELEYITPQETSLEERLQVSDTLGGKTELSPEIPARKISLLSRTFGLGWRNKNKADVKATSEEQSPKPVEKLQARPTEEQIDKC